MTLTRACLLILGCLTVLSLAGCNESDASGGDGSLAGKLVLSGSSTMAPLIGEIAKRFEALHADVRIDLQTGGSSRGIADAKRGLADIGMSSRSLKDSEANGVTSHAFARDGVGMLVHESNPVTNLTDAQIRGIYTGRITRWTEVGGHDAPITVVNRADGRSELDILCSRLNLTPPDLHANLISGENQHAIKTVSGDPDAIAYLSVGAAEYAIEHGESIKLVSWNGVAPSSATVASRAFPVARPLVLVTAEQPSALTEAFIEFALAEQSHDLIREYFYVPVQ